MKRLLAAALALACLSSSALAAMLQADPSSLRKVYDGASAGDIIQLATGAYGDVSFATYPQSKVFAAPGVVIMPAPGAKPVLASMNLGNGAGGVTVQDIEFALTGTGSAIAIAQGDAPKPGGAIHLKRLKIHGADSPTNAYAGVGVFVRSDGPDISIEDSEIYNLGLGVGFMDSTAVSLLNSRLHHLQVAGVDIAGSSQVTIDNNDFDRFYAGDGDHPDAIQSWSTADHRNVGLTITRNRIVASNPNFPPQGIFLANADNVVVRGNAMVGTLWNGISLGDVKVALVDDNFVQSAPWGTDPTTGTRIIVRGQSSGVTVSNNVASGWGQYLDGGQPNPGYVESGNTLIAATTRAADGTPNTADFLKWISAHGQAAPPVAAPPPVAVTPPPIVVTPPVVTPPPVDPLQATVDSLAAQVASLTAQVADLTTKLASAQTAATASAAQVKTLQTQLAAVQADLAAAKAKITKGRSALR